ncbi:MAG: Carbohydrate kinase, FGGY-like protein [Naasia sp.]|nr:Carbohydrate kinase, FGGY-like protein [Naasia sp.]
MPRPGAVALGIDVGSTNVKAALVAVGEGVRELAVCTAPTPADPDELVRVVLDLARSVLVASSEEPQVIGIASMAESGVPLGAGDVPLGRVLRWDGADDPADVDALVARFGADPLYAATGVPALPKAPLAMWARLRRTDPELWRDLRRWAGVADLVALSLTGVLATDHTLAARTMAYRTGGETLPNAFDPELLAAVGLVPDQLPAVRSPGEPIGTVTAQAAGTTGLPAGIPVHVAGHDHVVGAWAAGMRSPGDTADSIGTAEAVLRVLPAAPDPAMLRPTGMSVTRTVTGAPLLLSGSANAGSFVRWWFAHRIGAREPGELLDALAALPDSPSGVLVLPYLAGRQTPAPDRRSDVRILGPDGSEPPPREVDPVRLTRAMLEGVALHARWMIDAQTEVAGDPVPPLRILGGPGGGNRPWMRLKGHVLDLPARLVTATEPVAAGAALLAAASAGLLPGEAPVLDSTDLPGAAGDPYREHYDRFTAFAASGTEGTA